MTAIIPSRSSGTPTPAPSGRVTALGATATIRLRPSLGGPATAVLTGDLDLACADTLAAALCAAVRETPSGVRIDAAAVEFCDCAGLRALQTACTFARRLGRHFALERSSTAVDRILELAGDPSPQGPLDRPQGGRGSAYPQPGRVAAAA